MLMEFEFFIKGLIMGILGSIPLGPIGVLCIQRTLNKKFISGFTSGLGAATADSIFALVAIFFLSITLSFIESRMQLLTALGGIVITAIGVSIFFKKPQFKMRHSRANAKRLIKDYISTFLLTLTNPAYILVFVALFASVGIDKQSLSIYTGILTILGVFTGAATWWFILTFTINKVRRKFRPRHLFIMNRIAGAAIFALGVAAITSSFFSSEMQSVEKFIK